jgi:hypothetical protein
LRFDTSDLAAAGQHRGDAECHSLATNDIRLQTLIQTWHVLPEKIKQAIFRLCARREIVEPMLAD